MVFDKLWALGIVTVVVTVLFIVSASVDFTSDEWQAKSPLGLAGGFLQLIGVTIGAYTFRSNLRGQLREFFRTKERKIEYNPAAAGISILLILVGVWLQMVHSIYY